MNVTYTAIPASGCLGAQGAHPDYIMAVRIVPNSGQDLAQAGGAASQTGKSLAWHVKWDERTENTMCLQRNNP